MKKIKLFLIVALGLFVLASCTLNHEPVTKPINDVITENDESYTVTFVDERGNILLTVTKKTTNALIEKDLNFEAQDGFKIEFYNDANQLVDLRDVRTTQTIHVVYTPKVYMLGFYNNDVLIEAKECLVLETIPFPEDVVAPIGYEFKGWSISKDEYLPITSDEFAMPPANFSLYAFFEAKEYTLTLITNVNSLSNLPNTASYKYNERLGNFVPADLEAAMLALGDYEFVGWFKDASLTIPFEDLIMPAEDLTLYAKFEFAGVQFVAFDEVIQIVHGQVGDPVELPEPPERNGYEFVGWFNQNNEQVYSVSITENAQVIVAHYEKVAVDYKTEYYLQNLGQSFILQETVLGDDINQTAVDAIIKSFEGFTFDENNADNVLSGVVDADNMLVLKVYYTRNTYTIKFIADGNVHSLQELKFGQNVLVPMNPEKVGHTFIGWDQAIPSTMPAQDVTITAQFEINEYSAKFYVENLEPQQTDLLLLDFENTSGNSDYNDAHWTQQKYTSSWEAVSGQMRSRTKDSTKVVNITSGYSMTYKYTYTFDTPIEGAKLFSMKIGNYYSNAQVAPIKLAVVLNDANSTVVYILGDGSTFYNVPVTTGLVPFEADLNNLNIKAFYISFKSSANASVFLYLDDICFKGEVETTLYEEFTLEYGQALPQVSDPSREGYTFSGWDQQLPETMPASDLEFNGSLDINQYTLTMHVDGLEPAEAVLDSLDFENTAGTGDFIDSHWTQEYLTQTGFVATSGQMRSRMIGSTKVVNMCSTGQVPFKYTYTPDSILTGVTSLSLKVSNHFSGAQTIKAIVGVILENDDIVYLMGDGNSNTFVNIPVTAGLVAQSFDNLSNLNIKSLFIVMQSVISGTQYLYVDDIVFTGMTAGETYKVITLDYNSVIPNIADPVQTGYTFSGWNQEIPARMPASDLTINGSMIINQYEAKFFVEEEAAGLDTALLLDFETTAGSGTYSDSHWKQEKYTSSWQTISGQMNSRSKDGTKVVNMAGGYSTTYKYTYTADQVLTNITNFSFKFGNYYNAQPAKAKLALVLSDNTVYYLLGSTDTWYDIPVTTGLVPVAFENLPNLNVKGFYISFYSTINGSAYLYVDDFKFESPAEPQPYESFVVTYGEAIPAVTAPEKVGYTFVGWDQAIPSTMPAQNLVFRAQFEINQYTVKFVSDGVTISEEQLDYNSDITYPADPEKLGHTFIGWDSNIDKVPVGGITITAQWEEKIYSVSEILTILEAANLASNAFLTTDPLKVKGVVKSFEDGSYIKNLYLQDENNSSLELLVYSVNFDVEQYGFNHICVNDVITCEGYFKNYQGTLEMASYKDGNNVSHYCYMVARELGQSTVTVEDYNQLNGTVSLVASQLLDNDSQVEFSVAANDGYKVMQVTINGVIATLNANDKYEFVVLGNTTIAISIEEDNKYQLTITDTNNYMTVTPLDPTLNLLAIAPGTEVEFLVEAKAHCEIVSVTVNGVAQLLPLEQDTLTLTINEDTVVEIDAFYSGVTHRGTENDPLTVAEACMIADYAGSTATSERFYVVGAMKNIVTAFNADYNNISINLTDGVNDFQLYRLTITQEQANGLIAGALIKAEGKIKKYNSTKEFDSGCTFQGMTLPEYDITINDPENGSVQLSHADAIQLNEDLVLTFNPAEGYELYSVLVNGEEKVQLLSGNTITLEDVNGNLNIVVEFSLIPLVPTYAVTFEYTLDDSASYALVDGTLNLSHIDEGTNLQFSVNALANYKVLSVKVGQDVIAPEQGIYSYQVNGDTTITIETFYNVQHAGTADDPFDAADAIVVAKAIGSSETPAKYYISGVVASIAAEFNSTYKNISVNLNDGTNNFQIYRVNVASASSLIVGDTITVFASITTYGTDTYETKTIDQSKTVIVTALVNISVNDFENGSTTLPASAHRAEHVSFTVTANEGYQVSSVTFNGNALTLTDGQYSFDVADPSAIVITIIQIPTTSHNVTLNAEHVSSDDFENGVAEVGEGATFNFSLTADEEYLISKVYANGVEINPTNNTYSIENVMDDVEITVDLIALVMDTLNNGNTIKGTGTSYTPWTTAGLNVDYSGQSAGQYTTIQIRSNNNNSGIVSTSEIGNIRKVIIKFNSNTANDRIIDIYGSNDPYSAPTDLYNSNSQGTKLGSATKTSTNEEIVILISGDYKYVGIRSRSGAAWIEYIKLAYQQTSLSDAEKVAAAKEALTLPVTQTNEDFVVALEGLHGTTISWHSDNDAIVNFSGEDAIVTPGDSEIQVTLTATITLNSESDDKVFNIVVIPLLTEAEKVIADRDALDLENTTVTADFNLPAAGSIHGSVIEWESNNAAIAIEEEGGVITAKVTRPAADAEDAVVTLKATITKGAASDTKEFVITVSKEESGSSQPSYSTESLDFSQISGFSTWGNSYAAHSTGNDNITVNFVSASKQTTTITDIPVTKGGNIDISVATGDIQSFTINCRQWNSKTQTITVSYSTDGANYVAYGTTSNNFTLTADLSGVDGNVRYIRVSFSSTSNQVGIEGISITY